MGYGKLYQEVYGSHTEDEWQALVRKYMWRCFYCGSPMSAWRDWQSSRTYAIRSRNAQRWWETRGKVMSFVELRDVSPELILTKDHLVPLFHNNLRVEEIWNIRPCDLRCNRLKGQKTVIQFRNERPGLISQWISSLPADDWRVQEWSQFPTDEEIEAMIDRRFAQPVDAEAPQSTGVFVGASDSGLVLGSGVDSKEVAREPDVRQAPEVLEGEGFAVASESWSLRKAIAERERVSWFWRNRA